MLHALLHGKLDPTVAEPERLEDALTSTVFGTLAIVEAWDLIEDWLRVPSSAAPVREEHECWFWPRLAGGVEPHVILRIGELDTGSLSSRQSTGPGVMTCPSTRMTSDQLIR